MTDVDALFDSGSDDDDFQIKPRAPAAASPSDSGDDDKGVRIPQAPANPARLMRHDEEQDDDDDVDVVDYNQSRDERYAWTHHTSRSVCMALSPHYSPRLMVLHDAIICLRAALHLSSQVTGVHGAF